jgi:hypothetical protein
MECVTETFQAYNQDGDRIADRIVGTLSQLHGKCVHFHNGLIIQLADIRPHDGGRVITVYIDVSTLG